MATKPSIAPALLLVWLLTWALSTMAGLLAWSYINFGQVAPNVLVFYLRQGLEAALQLELWQIAMLFGFLALSLFVTALGFFIVKKLNQGQLLTPEFAASSFLSVALAGAVFVVTLVAAGDFSARDQAEEPMTQKTQADWRMFSSDPEVSALNGVNVIHIFFESLATDIDGVAGSHVSEQLESITSWSQVSFVSQEPEHSHTIAGMVASFCGNRFDTLNFLDPKHSSYLHGNYSCLPDVTKSFGYNNVYMGGADLAFQAKGSFLDAHNFESLGRDDWELLGEPRLTSWGQGLHDSRLFERAKSQVRFLDGEDAPFFLSLLTLDTHYPYYNDPGCPITGNPNDSRLSYTCTLLAIQDFVAWLEDYGVLENTLLLIQGDHLPIESAIHSEGSRIPVFVRNPDASAAAPLDLNSIFDIKSEVLRLLSAD